MARSCRQLATELPIRPADVTRPSPNLSCWTSVRLDDDRATQKMVGEFESLGNHAHYTISKSQLHENPFLNEWS